MDIEDISWENSQRRQFVEGSLAATVIFGSANLLESGLQ